MKSIFRPIEDGDDVSDIVKKCIIGFIFVEVVCILLMSGWAMYRSATENESESYRKDLIQREADPAWQKEAKRLKKKHGDQVIIYEPGREPYYKCNDGRKCWWI